MRIDTIRSGFASLTLLGALASMTLILSAPPAKAAVYCKYIGVPKGCVAKPGVVLVAAPVVATAAVVRAPVVRAPVVATRVAVRAPRLASTGSLRPASAHGASACAPARRSTAAARSA